MDCDPNALLAAARCFRCIPRGMLSEVQVYLLCLWLKKNNPSPPVEVFSYEPATKVIDWTDSGGPHSGDLSAFYAITAITGTGTVTDLVISGSSLTSVSNLSALPGLLTLDASDTSLISLDVSGLANLTFLLCNNTGSLNTLIVSGCTALSILRCNDDSLLASIIGLPTCTSLVTIDCSNCSALTTLDCTGLSSLTALKCYSCALTGATGLVLTGCAINTLDCSGNPGLGPTLDMSPFAATLVNLACSSCNFTTLTLTGCSLLSVLDANTNLLTDNFDTSAFVSITYIDVSGNLLTGNFDTSAFVSITYIDVSVNLLTSVTGLSSSSINFITRCSSNSLTVNAVDVVLNDMLTSIAQAGMITTDNQTPLAPPDTGPPNGIAAAAALTTAGWFVLTD